MRYTLQIKETVVIGFRGEMNCHSPTDLSFIIYKKVKSGFMDS